MSAATSSAVGCMEPTAKTCILNEPKPTHKIRYSLPRRVVKTFAKSKRMTERARERESERQRKANHHKNKCSEIRSKSTSSRQTMLRSSEANYQGHERHLRRLATQNGGGMQQDGSHPGILHGIDDWIWALFSRASLCSRHPRQPPTPMIMCKTMANSTCHYLCV